MSLSHVNLAVIYSSACELTLSFWLLGLWTAGMRERLPSGFRLGNKILSGQLVLLPGPGGGDSAGSLAWPEVGGGEMGVLSSWAASCPAQVSGKIQGGHPACSRLAGIALCPSPRPPPFLQALFLYPDASCPYPWPGSLSSVPWPPSSATSQLQNGSSLFPPPLPPWCQVPP